MTQNWNDKIRKQLNNLPGFPPVPTGSPVGTPATPYEWILGDWIDECHVRPEVANVASLPASGNEVGDVRASLAEQAWYIWDGAAWQPMGGGGGGGITQLTGDVLAGPGTGSQPATVVGLQTHPVSATAPTGPSLNNSASNVLSWNGSAWEPRAGFFPFSLNSISYAVPFINPSNTALTVTSVFFFDPPSGLSVNGVTVGSLGFTLNGPMQPSGLPGAIGEILTSQGPGTPPTWAAPSPVLPSIVLGTGPIQTIIAATDQITPVAALHRIQTNGSNKALTSTPQINFPGAVLGQVLYIQNVDPSFHVDLARGVAQGLSLSNANRRLDPGGTIMLVFNGTLWVEVSHTQGTTT